MPHFIENILYILKGDCNLTNTVTSFKNNPTKNTAFIINITKQISLKSLNLDLDKTNILIYLLYYLDSINYTLSHFIYKRCINNFIQNFIISDYIFEYNFLKLCKHIIKKDNPILFTYLIDKIDNNTIISKNIEDLLNYCLTYSLPIFYNLTDIYHDTNIINIINTHIINNKKFYKYSELKYTTIKYNIYLNLFISIKENITQYLYNCDIFKNLNITDNNYYFIINLVFFLKNTKIYNYYFKKLCKNEEINKIKYLIENEDILNCLHWKSILIDLIEYVSFDDTTFTYINSNCWLKIFKMLIPYFKIYISEDELRYTITNCNINSFITIKNNIEIIKELDKYIDYYHIDSGGFTLLFDCARYGSYNTFKYLLDKDEIKQNLFNLTYDYYNIISLSIYNPDERILQYLLTFLSETNYDKMLNLLSNETITNHIYAFSQFIRNTKNFKTIKKKINILDSFLDFKDTKIIFFYNLFITNIDNVKLGSYILKKIDLKDKIKPSILNNNYRHNFYNNVNNYRHNFYNNVNNNIKFIKNIIDKITIKTIVDIDSIIEYIYSNICPHVTQIYNSLYDKLSKHTIFTKFIRTPKTQNHISYVMNTIIKCGCCNKLNTYDTCIKSYIFV